MSIGTVVGLPQGQSSFARVRDEYGSEYTVHRSQIPEGAEVHDEYAYQVDVFRNSSGLAATLLKNKYYSID